MFTQEGLRALVKFFMILALVAVLDLLSRWLFDWSCWNLMMGFFLMVYIVNDEQKKAELERNKAAVTLAFKQYYRGP